VALSDLLPSGTNTLNPQDPYRQSLENALYNRQSDVINTQADLAQNQGRENAFAKGVGFSSILPDYTTAPIERERARALSNAAQNAFLGAGQEARANLAASQQPLQFQQSQAQQAGQFQTQQKLLQRQLAQQANQNLVASLGGGAAGLASLLLRPTGNAAAGGGLSNTLGGNLYSGLMSGAGSLGSGIGSLFSGGGGSAVDLGGLATNAGLGDLVSTSPDVISSLGGTGADVASSVDPSVLNSILSLFG
jgi:hypothetical protein